jgi:hypothetical protein
MGPLRMTENRLRMVTLWFASSVLCFLPSAVCWLLHTDCLVGTGVDTNAAVDADIGINLCFALIHRNSPAGAFIDTGFTPSAFFLVYLGWHYTTLSKSDLLYYKPIKKQYAKNGRNVTK